MLLARPIADFLSRQAIIAVDQITHVACRSELLNSR
jgi:hypothetical protein